MILLKIIRVHFLSKNIITFIFFLMCMSSIMNFYHELSVYISHWGIH